MVVRCIFFSLLFQVCFCILNSQEIDIEWEYNSINQNVSNLNTVNQTKDGGYIISAYLTTKEKVNPNIYVSNKVYQVIKLNTYGKEVWQRTLGGSKDDVVYRIIETKDGGFLIGGTSESFISGNKTIDTYGVKDIWVLKLDDNGNIEWQNTYGGISEEFFGDFKETNDGFIIGGSSRSIVNGNKTALKIGKHDYWLIKINKNGEVIWDKTYGGDEDDFLSSVTETNDGFFLLSGSSESNISGIKSEDSRGLDDFWLVKVDESGNFIWDKTIGGYNKDICQEAIVTSDGNILLSGRSNSGVSYDKTESFHFAPNFFDYWLFKIDVDGNEIWQKALPADSYNVIETKDDGFAIISFKYFDDEFEHNPNTLETFILTYDQDMNQIQEIFVGSFFNSNFYKLVQTNDKSFAIGGTKVKINKSTQETRISSNVIKLFDDINKEDLDNNINIFPNPFVNTINIDYDKDVRIKMYNSIGKKVLEANSKNIIIENLAVSHYLLHIYNVKGELISINKLLKR